MLRNSDEYKAEMQQYGTGSALQQGIQAATAAVQGLAGGDLAKALAGGSAPYLATIIAQTTEEGTSRLMAHAVVNAVLAAARGNNALAGAAGAVSGEVMAQLVMEALYPGKNVSELSESEKQTISMLGTLAAGLAGGLIGDSNADTLTAAQAGKTSVENNALGADAGTAFGFWFGKIPDCDTACKAEIAKETAEGNAVVSAGIANTAGVAALSGPAAAMWLLGAGANAGVQYADNGEVNPINAGIAGWVNVISMGNGLWGTVGWNAAGGALTNTINGDDPLTGAITTGAGAGLGYGVGNYIVKPVANAAGKWVTGGWNPKFDPNLLKYTEVKGQLGISKEMLPSKIPGGIGNIGSSVISEGSGSEAGNVLKKLGNGHEE